MMGNPYNLRESSVWKVWNVIYPVFIYYVVINLATYGVAVLVMAVKGEHAGYYMMIQTVATALTIPFLIHFCSQDRRKPTAYWRHTAKTYAEKSRGKKVFNGILMFLLGGTAGTALNNLIAMTGLEQMSQSYQEVSQRFFSGGALFELLGPCLMTPLLEELVYRGIVYPRLCDLMISDQAEVTAQGRARAQKFRFWAMVVSGVIFGAMHMNIVQFLYAGLLGILLAWLVDRSGHLYGAVLAHIGANLLAVLRAETGLLAWMEQGKLVFALSTAVLLATSVLLWRIIGRENGESRI